MSSFVQVEGLRIAYQREGGGRPIVFLHGFFGDHRVWRRQLELADGYTFVAWDAPGCGQSSTPPASATQGAGDRRAGSVRPHHWERDCA